MNNESNEEQSAKVEKFIKDALSYKLHLLYPYLTPRELSEAVELVKENMKNGLDEQANHTMISKLSRLGLDSVGVEQQIRRLQSDIHALIPTQDSDTFEPVAVEQIVWTA